MKTEKLDFAPILKKLSEKLNSKKFKEKIRKALNKDLKLNNDGQKLLKDLWVAKSTK